MTSDTGQIVLVAIAARSEWIAQIEQLLGMYGGIGFRSARILNMVSSALSSRLVQG